MNAFLGPAARDGRRREMVDGLFRLRKSPSHGEFLRRREPFQLDWFNYGPIPRWFRTPIHDGKAVGGAVIQKDNMWTAVNVSRDRVLVEFQHRVPQDDQPKAGGV